MNDRIAALLKIGLFFICVFLVIYGQRTIGRMNLFIQLIGLSGLIGLLWNYNRKYT